MVYHQRFEEAEKPAKRQKKELQQARKRIAELDRIFKRLYEDDINGTISHERFLKLSAEYEAEQKELTEFVKVEQAAVDTYEQDRTDFDSFAAVIRKYVGIRKLTPTIVNEFVKKSLSTRQTSPADIADRRLKLSGTLSGNWNKTRTSRPPHDREKAERHSLLPMSPCGNRITSLWICAFRMSLYLI